ncbi:hypothetical protein [Lysinibacillus fusiformis]|uniref:hypothetical protein n=1 Tax=Lysinibacillus fusiformis TaxID=28031 RepID=UPI003D085729
MKVLIDLEIGSKDDTFKKKASFGVDEQEFEINPDKVALKVAYQWFNRVRKEFSNDLTIKSARYNEVHDLTEGLKNVLNKETRIAAQNWKAPWE